MQRTTMRLVECFGGRRLPQPVKRLLKSAFNIKSYDDLVSLPRPQAFAKGKTTHVAIADDGRAEALSSRILEACDAAGLPAFSGGAQWPGSVRLNFDAANYRQVLDVIATLLRAEGLAHSFAVKSRSISATKLIKSEFPNFRLQLTVGVSSALLSETIGPEIEVDFWKTEPSYNGNNKCTPSMPNKLVSLGYSFSDVVQRVDRVKSISKMYKRTEDNDLAIDFVYTWVNDRDEVWANSRDQWAQSLKRSANAMARAHHIERFQNRNELMYSLRSVEMFAPWVRRIFIVTADQTPEWLNIDHPKIQIVSHRDIYRDQEALPTFNSSGIETQLHHIRGLSEHFVYFNDDMFLGSPVDKDDFFAGNGIARFYPAPSSTIPEMQHGDVEEYMQADINVVHTFREGLGISPVRIMEHVPYACRKSVLDEMEERFQAQFDDCARQRFRSSRDIRPIAFMHPHYAFDRGLALPAQTQYRYLALWKPTIVAQLAGVLSRRNYKFFCINDVGVLPERQALIYEAVSNFLLAYFPLKSQFEK